MRGEKRSKGVEFMLLTPNYPKNPLHPNSPNSTPPPPSQNHSKSPVLLVFPRGQCLLVTLMGRVFQLSCLDIILHSFKNTFEVM